MENGQTIIRIKKLEPNLNSHNNTNNTHNITNNSHTNNTHSITNNSHNIINNHSNPVDGIAPETHAPQNPSDASNQSVDDVIVKPQPPPSSNDEDSKSDLGIEIQPKFEISISEKSRNISDDEENEDMIKVKPPRPPRKKVKETLKEALYEEDIIEGFSFVGFKTYEDLERMTTWSAQHNGKFPDPYSKLKLDHEKNKEKKKKKKKDKHNPLDEIEKSEGGFVLKHSQHHEQHNVKTGSSGSSSEKGYICDSDSDGDKGSENGRSDFFGSRNKDSCRNGNLSRPPSGMISSSNPVGYIKQEHPSVTLPTPTETLPTESAATAASATATTVVSSANSLLPPPSAAPFSTPLSSTTTTTPTSASAAAAPRGLYRPYSTSPPATPKKQAPPLSSPASSVGGFSTQSYSHMPLTSTGAPQYSPVPYYPYAKENNEVSPSGNIAIKSEESLMRPAIGGGNSGSFNVNQTSFSSHKVKSSSSTEGSSGGMSHSSDPSAINMQKTSQQIHNKTPTTGIEPYTVIRNSLQAPISSLGSMPPPQARPIQTGPTTMLPESSPQSDWLRRELDSRFLASQDRGGPRGLPSPFMVQPSVQPQLGPPGSLMRPVMPPPPGASFLARSLEAPKIGLPGPGLPGSGLPGFPGLSPLASPLSLRPTGSFVPPTFQANLTPKKSGKWNAMHVRIAWEIYNHQHKQNDPNKSSSSQPQQQQSAPATSSLNTSTSSSPMMSGILSNELNKRPSITNSDNSKFLPPVLSRPLERQNPFGIDNNRMQQTSTRTASTPMDSLTSSFPGLPASTSTTSSLPTSTPSFGGLGSLHNPESFSNPGLPPTSVNNQIPMSMSNDPFGITRSIFTSTPNHISRPHDFMLHNRLLEERDREKREQRKRNDEILSGKRSPLVHQHHRSPLPERSPLSAPGSSPVSPLVTSKQREDRPSSVNTNASSSQFSRQQSDSEDGSKNNEVTFVGEKRSTHPPSSAQSQHRSSSSSLSSLTTKNQMSAVPGGLPPAAGMVPGTFRPPLPQSQASPYASFGPGMPPSPFMDPRTMALYGSMMPQANPFFQPGLDPFRDPYRGLNPFLKDQLAERELLNRFNTLIATEQDRQRMAAMSAAYPPGFFPPTSAAAAYLGPQAAGLGGKLPQPPPPHHLAAMYPNYLGAPPGMPAHLGGHPRLDLPSLGGNPPGSQPPSDLQR